MRGLPAICGLCPHGCWVRAHVCEGELVAVTAGHDDRYGNLCSRGRLAPQIIYSPDRIKKPLIRSGPKGKSSFREASWDEALDRIAEEFKAIRDRLGPQALASYMGAGTLEDGLTAFFKKALEPFGSPNDIDCGSVCYVSSRILAPLTTLGIEADSITPDFENADTIIIWGTNPLKDGTPDKIKRIRKAQRNGAKLIVIDPRRSGLARDADLWAPILPGTDGALAHAIMNIIIMNKWFDAGFVERWTLGFDDLAKYGEAFTPDKTAKICGTDPALLTRIAEAFSPGSRVAVDFYSGLEYAPSGVQNTRAVYSLVALTGNLDVDGGLYIHAYPHEPCREYMYASDVPPLGAREYPLFYSLTGRAHISGLANAVLHDDPYPVRGLLLVGGSPYLSYPDPETWRRVCERLDFTVVIDRFMPEEAAWADVILPAATYFEIESYHTYRDSIRIRHRVIEPVHEAKNDAMILLSIEQRLGYGGSFPQSEEEIIKQAFAGDPDILHALRIGPGIAALPMPERRTCKYESGHLRSDGRPGFPTPSGRFEFASILLERYGYEPLPVYRDPRLDKSRASSLVLTTGARTRSKFNSQYLDLHELGSRNRPVLEIHPLDAESRGIEDGASVLIRTTAGELVMKAQVTENILPGAVHAPSGGGGCRQLGEWKKAHVNSIIPSDLKDPISGYPAVKTVNCEVFQCEEVRRDGGYGADAPLGLQNQCHS